MRVVSSARWRAAASGSRFSSAVRDRGSKTRRALEDPARVRPFALPPPEHLRQPCSSMFWFMARLGCARSELQCEGGMAACMFFQLNYELACVAWVCMEEESWIHCRIQGRSEVSCSACALADTCSVCNMHCLLAS